MGGQRTAVSPETTDVFFEVAFFAPEAIIGRARRWGLLTDAVQRYERGIDPTQQRRAIERALGLLTSIAGGSPGPVVVTQSAEHQPKRAPVRLRRSRLERLLGVSIPDARVTSTLEALEMKVVSTSDGWEATPPAYRFDIAIEADLIEEVARIVGFEAIPERDAWVPQQFRAAPEERPLEHTILETLANRGYQEAVTYAFVDPALQTKLFPDREGLALSNPIASDLSVMRGVVVAGAVARGPRKPTPSTGPHSTVRARCPVCRDSRRDRAATERRPSGQRGNPQRGPAREPPAGASEGIPRGDDSRS